MLVVGLAGLPNAIDVEKFVEVRFHTLMYLSFLSLIIGACIWDQCHAKRYENGKVSSIRAVDLFHCNQYKHSEASTFRVWQTLPRHLRRRAASHNVHRVPLALRDRARAEARFSLIYHTLVPTVSSRWMSWRRKPLVDPFRSQERINALLAQHHFSNAKVRLFSLVQHDCVLISMSQEIKYGLKHIYGTRSECIWTIYGVIAWFVDLLHCLLFHFQHSVLGYSTDGEGI